MRHLATIQRVVSVEPIPNADSIEKVTVLGWELVAKKGEFKQDDMVVYVEIDSVLPSDNPAFEFMGKYKYRVKTIKLRGQVSQGICFPTSILPSGKYGVGTDVTELLKIKKWVSKTDQEENERIEAISKKRMDKFMMRHSWYRKLVFKKDKTEFPKFIPKTDEERIQNFPHICEKEKDTLFDVTEKLDGSSATYFVIKNPKKWQFWKKTIFGVCSRNFQLLKPDNSPYWTIARKYDVKNKLNKLRKDVGIDFAIQGEIIGPKLQGNKYGLSELDFYMFNYYSITERRYVDNINVAFIGDVYGFKTVPIIDTGINLLPTIPQMVEYAKGKSVIADIQREGIVVRNNEKNISFKVINPDFLIKYDE